MLSFLFFLFSLVIILVNNAVSQQRKKIVFTLANRLYIQLGAHFTNQLSKVDLFQVYVQH